MKKPLLLALLASMLWSASADALVLTPAESDGLNVRKGPGTTYEVITALPAGATATVVGRQPDWYRIRLADGREGYTSATYSRLLYADGEANAVVTTDVLNIRSGPGLSFTVLGRAVTNESFPLREVRGDWWRITYKGADGWVYGAYVQEAKPASTTPQTPPPVIQPPPAPVAGKGVTLTVAQAVVRNGRATEYDEVDTVRTGEQLLYVDAAEGWVRVRTPRGITGWLPGQQVALWDGDVEWPRRAHYTVAEGSWNLAFLAPRTVARDGVLLRQSASASAASLGSVPKGTVVKVLAEENGWHQALTESGITGWLEAAATIPVTSTPPRIQTVKLQMTEPGVFLLEVTGALSGLTLADDSATQLLLNLPDAAAAPKANLQVAAAGLTGASVDSKGLQLSFTAKPPARILEQTASKLRVELKPAISGVSVRQESGNIIYRIGVQGYSAPVTAVENDGKEVVLTVPGARFAAFGVPPELRAQVVGTGIQFRIASLKPFSIKRVESGFDLVLYTSGLAGKLIMIDPGHGGSESGAVNHGLLEKELNLDVSFRLKALLEAKGARVVMTRTADTRVISREKELALPPRDRLRADLNARTTMANEQKVDLFISVHGNAYLPESNGTETYYSENNLNGERSKALARSVQRSVVKALGRRDAGAKAVDYYVVTFTEAPAVLAELAYLSNAVEAKLLADSAFRQRAAEGLLEGTRRFFTDRPDRAAMESLRQQLVANPYRKPLYDAYIQRRIDADEHTDLATFVLGREVAFDVRPVIRSGRTLVPIRAIAEALGANVGWDATTRTVTVAKGTTVLRLQIDNKTAHVNGKPIPLDVAPQIEGGRTLIPLRFLSEGLGYVVTWMDASRSIIVTDKPLTVADTADPS